MPDPDLVMAVAGGFVDSKMAFVANEIGMFEALGPAGATAAELAVRCGVPERSARIVADVLATRGLLLRAGDRYLNSPAAEAFLAGRGPIDLRPMLRYWDTVSYPGAVLASQAVRTGQGVQGPLDSAQALAYGEFIAFATGPIAAVFAEAYDFSGHQRVLDLGGGLGTVLRPILSRYPHLTGTLVDLPEIAALASADLAAGPTAGRVEVTPADLFRDPLPAGHDAIVVAHLLHLFPPDQNRMLLQRIREIAPEHGRLLLVDWWRVWADPPPVAVYGAVEFLLKSGGDTYPPDEVAEWLAATGWRLVEHRELVEPAGLLIAEPVA